MKTSVALCTYNGEKFLNKQIDSILKQTLPVDEIIVCDDGSTDATVSILESYKNLYPDLFHIYLNKINLNTVKNFEKAITLCNNEIIFLCDQDDIWQETKAEKVVNVFKSKDDVVTVFTNAFIIDENDQVLDILTLWDAIDLVKNKGYKFDFYNILNLVDNFCTGATMAIRKDLKKSILPFPIIKNFYHDGWIAKVAALQNGLIFLDEKITCYRQHSLQQVGSVFYEKTEKDIEFITSYFSIESRNPTFKNYKNLLKRFFIAYQNNLSLLSQFPENSVFFNNNLLEIKKRFCIKKKEMRTRYPIKSVFLEISDWVLGKRKM